MSVKKYIVFYFLLTGLSGFSQTTQTPFKFWQLTGISGQVNLRGNYRETESIYNDFTSKHSEAYLNGLVQVRTQSFFVHPNFMLFNLNGTYNPETVRNSYIGIPDYTEKSNSQGFDASAVFFKKRNFNLATNASVYNSIRNIDNLVRIKATSQYQDAQLNYANKFLPFSLIYSHQKTDEKTMDIDRSFNTDARIFQSVATKSFTAFDNQVFSYLHSENSSLQHDVGLISPQQSLNKADLWSLTNGITFGPKKNYSFSSSIADSRQWGTTLFKSLSINENLTISLPKNFVLYNNYNYRQTSQEETKIDYQRFQSILSHQLYESLTSRLSFEHSQTDQNSYNEQRNKGGIDFRYIKKIRDGKLMLLYSYYKEYQSVATPSSVLYIVHEEYALSDSQITILRNQNVIAESVVVKDVTGTIIYRPDLDYILIANNSYIQVVRVPGGMIANNASVFLNYTVSKPGFYKYDMNTHTFAADVWAFKNLLNVYYRFYNQEYGNNNSTEIQTLNIFTRHIIGARVDFYSIKGGVEYEYYYSHLLPYQGMKYFITYQKMFKDLYFTMNANVSDYMMTSENSRRQDIDFTSKVAYSLLKNIKINLDYMYRTMKGRGISMDVHSSRLEITTNLHRLFLSVGTELYWSRNENNKTNYKGSFIQLSRYF